MAETLEVTPAELDAFADRLGEVESYLHLDEKRTRVTELEAKSVAPGFWDDADAARATMERLRAPKEDIAAVDTARGELSDARAALELAEEMGDDPMPLRCVRRLPPRRSAYPRHRRARAFELVYRGVRPWRRDCDHQARTGRPGGAGLDLHAL